MSSPSLSPLPNPAASTADLLQQIQDLATANALLVSQVNKWRSRYTDSLRERDELARELALAEDREVSKMGVTTSNGVISNNAAARPVAEADVSFEDVAGSDSHSRYFLPQTSSARARHRYVKFSESPSNSAASQVFGDDDFYCEGEERDSAREVDVSRRSVVVSPMASSNGDAHSDSEKPDLGTTTTTAERVLSPGHFEDDESDNEVDSESDTPVDSASAAGTYDHFLIIGSPLELPETSPQQVRQLTRKKSSNVALDGFNSLFGRVSKSPVTEIDSPAVLLHHSRMGAELPNTAESIAKFCFPRGVTRTFLSPQTSMSDINSILLGPHCRRNDGSFIFTFNDDTSPVMSQATVYGVCVTQPRIVGDYTVPRVYCVLTRVPHFDLHFRVLWDILASQRIARMPVGDMTPGADLIGYDTLDFVKDTVVRYGDLNIDTPIGTFVSFQVCNHLPPIVFRPVTSITKLLTACERDERVKKGIRQSIHGNVLNSVNTTKSWVELRRESISATSSWSLATLFSMVPLDILVQVIGELLKETQLIVLSNRLSMLSSTVLGLAYLLKPFLWVGPIIPLLPHSMNPILGAPVPFIAGFPGDEVPEDVDLQGGVGILNLEGKNGVEFTVTDGDGVEKENVCASPASSMPYAKLLMSQLAPLYNKFSGEYNKTTGPMYNPSDSQLENARIVGEGVREHIVVIVTRLMEGKIDGETAKRISDDFESIKKKSKSSVVDARPSKRPALKRENSSSAAASGLTSRNRSRTNSNVSNIDDYKGVSSNELSTALSALQESLTGESFDGEGSGNDDKPLDMVERFVGKVRNTQMYEMFKIDEARKADESKAKAGKKSSSVVDIFGSRNNDGGNEGDKYRSPSKIIMRVERRARVHDDDDDDDNGESKSSGEQRMLLLSLDSNDSA
jgi:hypothetical protein